MKPLGRYATRRVRPLVRSRQMALLLSHESSAFQETSLVFEMVFGGHLDVISLTQFGSV